MEQYIPKSALLAEIERLKDELKASDTAAYIEAYIIGAEHTIKTISDVINTLEVKEVDLELEQRIKECPFRQVVCNKYEDTPVECDCNCSWVVDYPKLKELKAQKEK